MTSSETESPKISSMKFLIFAGAAVLVAGLGYLGYITFAPRSNPCESLFEQTTTSTHQKIESLKKQGAQYLQNGQMQVISSQAQQVALGLKSCCILFHEDKISFEEFVNCQNSFNDFETGIERVNALMAEIQDSKNNDQPELTAYKSDRLLQTLQSLQANYKKFESRIADYAQRSPEIKSRLGTLSQTAVTAETEPNDAYKDATSVSMGVLSAGLSEADKKDFFKFEIPSGNIFRLEFTPAEAAEPMNVSLHDVERHEIWSLDGVVPGVTKSTKLIMNSDSGGKFFIIVSGGRGDYRISLALQSQNDAGSGSDAADRIAGALKIMPQRTYPGQLGGYDTEDWYQFEITPGHVLNLAFTPDAEAEAMNFSLRNFERHEIWNFEKVTPGVTKSRRVITNALSGTRYYLAVYDGRGAYTVEITTESQNDADSGTDAGDQLSKAAVIKPGRSYSGELGGLDEEDWYQFEIPGGGLLEYSFMPQAEVNPMAFALLNSERREVWHSGEVVPGVARAGRLLMNSTSGGTYYLKAFQGAGVYQLALHTRKQNDAGSGTDAGDSKSKATTIASGRTFSGELGGLDEEDWYTFEPRKGEKLKFTCDRDSELMRLALRTLEQGEVGYAAEIFPGMTKSFEIPEEVDPPYFIRIFDGEGRYSIEIK